MSVSRKLLVPAIVAALSMSSLAPAVAVEGPSTKDPLGDLARASSQIDRLEKDLEVLSREFRDPGTLPARREKIRTEGLAIQQRFESAWEKVLGAPTTKPPWRPRAPALPLPQPARLRCSSQRGRRLYPRGVRFEPSH